MKGVNMSTIRTAGPDIEHALSFWADYQKEHDVSDRRGQAVGIDPIGRRVWFGESAIDIKKQLENEGVKSKVILIRVGSDYYYRKGNVKSWGVM
jgi:hypothetical protein